MRSRKKFYAVAIGRKPGIYHSWPACKKQVHRYGGARFKGFETEEECRRYIREIKGTSVQPGSFSYVFGVFEDSSRGRGKIKFQTQIYRN